MTTETLTLTDFLLARIAEDEAVIRKVLDSPYYVSAPVWGGTYEAVPDEPHSSRTDYHLAVDPARVLAECEAKRRIVKRCNEGANNVWIDGAWYAHHPILRELALPYADHPDYRGEWRP